MSGFSARNLKYMRKFAETWPEKQMVQELLAQISWYHNLALMEKLKDHDLRLWYARKTIENGWSRNILAVQIETKLHRRIGQTANNFEATLPPAEFDMANQIFKDPYLFDFLGTTEVRLEAELERKLIDHLEKFLLELGQGFALPIGVAEWKQQITDALPEELKPSLPSIEEIERELDQEAHHEK